jgi:ATP-binding cassette subfamily E protein 1
MRIAVLKRDQCKNGINCNFICGRVCPINRTGKECIIIGEDNKPLISEELCTGCGICPKKCPFKAISIIGLPEELKKDIIHQYGENAFRLFRLPYPRENSVTGIIGQNGMGKTTIVKIFSGELIPNFGNFKEEGNKEKVLEYYSGLALYDFFYALYENEINVVHKPQYVDLLPKAVKGNVGDLLKKVDEKGDFHSIVEKLELEEAIERDIDKISGGELQRVAIAACLLKDADFYILDEPSSYLDVKQRLNVARLIREIAKDRRVLVVEHDLVVLDYLADYVNMMYGSVGAYGIVSHPRLVRQGINVYLQGYLKEENIRFRDEPVKFEVRPPSEGWGGEILLTYSDLKKNYNGFSLEVEGGEIRRGEVIGAVGPNATGKTTFVKMLANIIKPDVGIVDLKIKVSYKPQYIKPDENITVLEALNKAVDISSGIFQTEISNYLDLEFLYERQMGDLSGGELQRVAIAICLGREADIYLLDEPSAYLDVEQRLKVAKMIRRVMEKREATGIVVDHDILFIDYISDRIMAFYGKPGVKGYSTKPLNMREGMNAFLKDIGVTFRRDKDTGRPRINKEGSKKDREQKDKGEYYYR